VTTRSEPTLTQRALNRALLARQGLLERATVTVPQALQSMGGLQAQYAPSMYVGLWSRVAGLERGEVTRRLERRSVVQGTLLRSTIHLVPARDYWPFALGVRQARRDWYLRVTRDSPGAGAGDLARAADRLRAALADGPMRAADIDALLGRPYRLGIGLWLDLVRVPPAGTWDRRRADLYATAESWLGPPKTSAEEGQELLVRRYLAAFGPATKADVASWSGLPARVAEAVLGRLRLRRFRTEDGAELVDLPRGPLPDPEQPAPVRFLPTWDATLLVHARRTQILPERHRAKVFHTKMPQSVGTFLVDGSVAGSWRYEQGQVRIEEFEPLPKSVRREVDRAAEELAAFHS
jgi:hypothetical protein